MLTPEQVAEKAYPAILKGQRVIIPGVSNQLAAFLGKVLPFPWSIRLMEFIYNLAMEPMAPEYPPATTSEGILGPIIDNGGKTTDTREDSEP